MKTLSVLLYVALCVLSMSAWSQTSCPSEFMDIGPQCIYDGIEKVKAKKGNKKFSSKPLPLSSLPKDAVYFYQTTSGELGKLRIISLLNKPQKECTIFIDAVTYGNGNSAYVPNSSLSISPGNNHWLPDKIYLNREGTSALILEKISQEDLNKRNNVVSNSTGTLSKASCVLIPTGGTNFALIRSGTNEEKKFKEQNNILLYSPLVLIFVAIFLIVRVFMEDQDKFKTQEALEDAENSGKIKSQALFLRITRPFYKRYFLPIIQSSKHKQNFRNKYRQKLANAGLTKEMSPEEFVALKFFMIIGGPFAFLAVRYITESDWSLSITPIMGLVGFFYPDIWLSGMISRRSDEVLRAMPFIVDMLALSVEAGLDFMAAIQRVIDKAPRSALVEEFETLIKETKIGSSRAEGLRQLGWRVNIIEINSFCATLIAADSVGASIGPLLKQLSNELRVKRTSRAEQAGATAATKILIPMIFFILPAVLVAIFAPMILKMISGKL